MNTKKTWKVRTIDLRQLEHYLNETNETVFGIYPSVNLSGSVEVVSYTEPFVPVAPGSTSPIKQVNPTAEEAKAADAKAGNEKEQPVL